MKRCEHCGGDGYNDLYPDNVCTLCHGGGEVPDNYRWNTAGNLIIDLPRMKEIDPMSKKPETFEELYQDYDAGIAAMSNDPVTGMSPDVMDDLRAKHEALRVDAKPDGFRKRRKRPKGWLEKAIKDGSVRDPELGPNPPEDHAPDATIISVPVMTAKQED